jgi:hypothetical protein
VNSSTKFQVQQHLATEKHKKNQTKTKAVFIATQKYIWVLLNNPADSSGKPA